MHLQSFELYNFLSLEEHPWSRFFNIVLIINFNKIVIYTYFFKLVYLKLPLWTKLVFIYHAHTIILLQRMTKERLPGIQMIQKFNGCLKMSKRLKWFDFYFCVVSILCVMLETTKVRLMINMKNYFCEMIYHMKCIKPCLLWELMGSSYH